ncbi:MAG: hypothetical protein ACRENG_31545 [bacterium]
MQTYGNFTSGYRPHLDSADFMKTLRVGVVIAWVLSVSFSIRGNYLGLEQTLEKDFFWLMCIGAGITLTSAFLSMLTVIDIPGLKRSGRILVGIAAIGLFYASTRLTLIGFGAGEGQRQENLIQEHPDVAKARQDLDAIVKRQRQYGVNDTEKQSLLAREKEQRAWLRETETRVRMELGDNVQSRAAQVMGDEAEIARQIFAVAPDLSIMVLSPILVLLFGAAGTSQSKGVTQQPEKQVVYVQAAPVGMPGNGYHPAAGVQPNGQAQNPDVVQPAPSGTNGKAEFTPIGVNQQPAAWNPF